MGQDALTTALTPSWPALLRKTSGEGAQKLDGGTPSSLRKARQSTRCLAWSQDQGLETRQQSPWRGRWRAVPGMLAAAAQRSSCALALVCTTQCETALALSDTD